MYTYVYTCICDIVHYYSVCISCVYVCIVKYLYIIYNNIYVCVYICKKPIM